MLSQPATSIWLKTKEPAASEWVSKFIGKVEIERLRETHFDGSRAGRNFTLDRQIEPLVMESEISGLADLHAYLKFENVCDTVLIPSVRYADYRQWFRSPGYTRGQTALRSQERRSS
jgi:hypothetical protein